MSAELRRRLVHGQVTTKPGGQGIGLAGARQFARSCGGTLRLFSAPGRGTVVMLRLPV
jgi:signal transduction histidine kinase